LFPFNRISNLTFVSLFSLLGNSRTDFAPQLDGFNKEKFTLIAWDSPGMGLSRPPERNYKLHGIDKFYYQYDAETIGKMMTVSHIIYLNYLANEHLFTHFSHVNHTSASRL
jgi:valacyclovir hydrolase